MTIELFLTAIIACSTGQATCSSYDIGDMTYVSVCDVVHERYKDDFDGDDERTFKANIDGDDYELKISAFCEGV